MFQIAKDIELTRLKSQLIDGSNFNIEALDDSKLVKAICLSIHHSVISQKRLLIILPDQYDFSNLSHEVKELGLLEHCLFIINEKPNNLNDIYSLLKANIPKTSLDTQSLTLFKEDYNSLLNDLEKDYNSLLDKSTFNASIADLVEIKSIRSNDRTVQEISTLFHSYNLHDFKVLYSNILNTANHHHEAHGLRDNEVAPEYFTDGKIKGQQHLIDKIGHQILSAESLIDQIDQLMLDQFNTIHAQASNLLINTTQRVSIIKEQFLLEEAASRPVKKSFFSRKNENKNSETAFVTELQTLKLELQNNEVLNKTIDFNLFNDVLEKDLLHKLTNYLKTVIVDEAVIRSIISRTNISQIANDPNQRLVAIEDALSMYQEDSILNEQARTGGFTLNHKKKALKHDLTALKQMQLSFSINPKLFDWYQLYYQLSELERAVIDTLLFKSHQKWSKLLQSAYIEFVLTESRDLFSHLSSKRFESALRLERLIQEEEYKIARNNISAYRQNIKNEHTSNNNPILETIKNSKSNISAYQNLFDNHLESLVDYFQVCIVSASKYSDSYGVFNKERSILLNLNATTQIENKDSQVICLTNKKEEQELFKEDPQLFSISDSSTLLLPYPKPIEVVSGEKIKRNISWARNLSTNIYALHSKYRIYQTKNLGIISFWSEHKDQILQQLAGPHAIKEISFTGENGMVETLLDESKKTVFLFQDGLINPKYPKLYHWQFYLIQLLKTADIACYNIWSSDYLKHGSQLIKSIAEEIALKPPVDIPEKPSRKSDVATTQNS